MENISVDCRVRGYVHFWAKQAASANDGDKEQLDFEDRVHNS